MKAEVYSDYDLYEPMRKPGAMMQSTLENGEVCGFIVCCPSCGKEGSLQLDNHPNCAPGRTWHMTGYPDAITLTPSILKHCCGWHGYLRNGEFVDA